MRDGHDVWQGFRSVSGDDGDDGSASGQKKRGVSSRSSISRLRAVLSSFEMLHVSTSMYMYQLMGACAV